MIMIRRVDTTRAPKLTLARARHYHQATRNGGAAVACSLAEELRVDSKGAIVLAVQMELTRIIISENNEQQIIFLKEVEGDRTFPIVIGIFEATSIDRRVKNLPAPRPLTHDLLASTIELLEGELQDIFISELRDHTYFAKLRIRHRGELIEVDSRPSDAIAVAVTVDVPIYRCRRSSE